MRLTCGALLLIAACTDPTPPPTTTATGLDACDGNLGLLWQASNLHGEIVSQTPVTPDGTIVLGSIDGSVKQWTLDGDPETLPSYGTPFTQDGMPARALALGAAGDRVIAGDDGVGLHAWAIPSAEELGATLLKGSPFTAVAPRTDTEIVVADSAFGGEMRVVDLAGGAGTGVFDTRLWDVTAMTIAGDTLYDVGDWYGVLGIERRDLAAPETAVEYWTAQELNGWLRSVAVSDDGAWLVAGGDGHLVVFAADNLTAGPVAQLDLPGLVAKGVAFTPSGDHVAVTTDDGHATIYDRALTAPTAAIDVAQPIGAAIDPSGTMLLAASGDGHLRAFGCTN
jgi:WD40 repeat protein